MSRRRAQSNTAQMVSGQPADSRILHKRILHKILSRAPLLIALLGCVVSLTASSAAQREDERPQIAPGNRNVPRKKDAGPRAIAVLQLTASGKSSLVPVAILIGGKFWDASAYKADPIPMALETGTVYEAERTGTTLGLFTVSGALHSNAANVISPWLGTGKWVPAGSEEKTSLKAETVPAGIDTSDQAPRLTRDPAKINTPPDSAPAATPAPPAKPSSESGDGEGPPRITKGTPAPPADPAPVGQSQPAPGATPTAPPADSKPTDTKPADTKADATKPADAKPSDAPKPPESDSGASEANRPTLRRGKPVDPLPDDTIPGYSKPGAMSAANAAKPADPAADKGPGADKAPADKTPPQLIPAISDATGPDPRTYGFTWLKDEEGERRLQLIALAKEQVRAYVEARAKAKIVPAPKTAGAQAAHHAAAAKTKDPILENVQMTAYDLWNTNQPVIIFSAEAHLPPPPAGSAFSAVDAELQYSVMLVTYPDIYNNLHKIYSGVTDKFHLDLTPRLELVDAVDADGDLRGELLFREISDAGTGWVIYRASADKLWKLFDSLHPE